MKAHGRPKASFSETDLEMIKEYLETDKSYVEVAYNYKISPSGLAYKVKKYQKLKQEEAEKNESSGEN